MNIFSLFVYGVVWYFGDIYISDDNLLFVLGCIVVNVGFSYDFDM